MLRVTFAGAACLALASCGQAGDGNEAASGPAATANAAQAGDRPGAAQAGREGKASLLDSLRKSPDFATLTKVVDAAGLTETLSGAQPYTLFAPAEAAFQALPAGSLEELMAPEAKGRLTALLTNHIVPGTVTAGDLARAIERGKGKAQLATVGGMALSFAKEGDAIVVSDGKGGRGRVSGGTEATNGVIHAIDAVMTPR